jgi:hypothetical protein
MRTIAALVAMAVLTSPCVAQAVQDDEKALRDLWARFEEYVNQFDAAQVASLYAADGDRINAAGEHATGRADSWTLHSRGDQGGRSVVYCGRKSPRRDKSGTELSIALRVTSSSQRVRAVRAA